LKLRTDIAVLTLGGISFVVSLLPFQTIMGFVVFLASISVIISFACLIRLRIDLPDLERPFKVPFGTLGVVYLYGAATLSYIYIFTSYDFSSSKFIELRRF
jgi:amino acid transporter